jgi:hypothetical protein
VIALELAEVSAQPLARLFGVPQIVVEIRVVTLRPPFAISSLKLLVNKSAGGIAVMNCSRLLWAYTARKPLRLLADTAIILFLI